MCCSVWRSAERNLIGECSCVFCTLRCRRRAFVDNGVESHVFIVASRFLMSPGIDKDMVCHQESVIPGDIRVKVHCPAHGRINEGFAMIFRADGFEIIC